MLIIPEEKTKTVEVGGNRHYRRKLASRERHVEQFSKKQKLSYMQYIEAKQRQESLVKRIAKTVARRIERETIHSSTKNTELKSA